MSISYYDNNAETFFDTTVNVDLSNIYEEFIPHLPMKAHVLDAGCGSGRDSLHFKHLGFTVTAFDASASLVNLATQLLKQKVTLATFNSFTSEHTFDGIWACASLLHVSTSALTATFIKLSGLLNSGGVFYCSFKYGNQEISRDGRTFTNLNDALLRSYLDNTSLVIHKTWITSDQRPDRANEKWLNAILLKV